MWNLYNISYFFYSLWSILIFRGPKCISISKNILDTSLLLYCYPLLSYLHSITVQNILQTWTKVQFKEDPVNPHNNENQPGPVKESLILTCLPRASSTAAKIQKMTLAQKAQKISTQIRDFSWDQTEDLIVT